MEKDEGGLESSTNYLGVVNKKFKIEEIAK